MGELHLEQTISAECSNALPKPRPCSNAKPEPVSAQQVEVTIRSVTGLCVYGPAKHPLAFSVGELRELIPPQEGSPPPVLLHGVGAVQNDWNLEDVLVTNYGPTAVEE